MAHIEPTRGRAHIESQGNELRVSIPTRKRVFIILLLSAWIAAWAVGLVQVASAISGDAAGGVKLFFAVWLAIWAMGGLVGILILLWTLFGSEQVTVCSQFVRTEKLLLGMRLRSKYGIQDISNLRVTPQPAEASVFAFPGQVYGLTGGTIAFDYGMKTVKLGIALERAEARHIIDEIKKHSHIKD